MSCLLLSPAVPPNTVPYWYLNFILFPSFSFAHAIEYTNVQDSVFVEAFPFACVLLIHHLSVEAFYSVQKDNEYLTMAV